MDISPLCAPTPQTGYSWPWQFGHWWMSLNATEQGTWVAGMGAFAAAVVALGISLSEGRRRMRERQVRARLTMASFYSPIAGIYAMVQGFQKEGAVVAGALSGAAVLRVAPEVDDLKIGWQIARECVGQCNLAEAAHLPGDFGPLVAAAIRDVELMINLISSCTDVYLPLVEHPQSKDLVKMHRVCASLKNIPDQAQATLDRLAKFLSACVAELGELLPEVRLQQAAK